MEEGVEELVLIIMFEKRKYLLHTPSYLPLHVLYVLTFNYSSFSC